MFRATSARNELYDLDESDDTLRCKVMIYDSVMTDRGLTKVNTLNVGDPIALEKRGKGVFTKLVSIEDTDDILYKILVLNMIEDQA